jgi:AcrR family transcriptional regulator
MARKQAFKRYGKEMSSSERRNPSQQRSQERVDTILQAAAGIITEEGTGALKMAQIAKAAGVTKGSIYQYFPNTAAIVRALAEGYAERYRQVLSEKLNQIDSIETLILHSRTFLNDLWQMYRSEPVLKEIGLATSLDKSLQSMDILDSRINADLLFQAYRPFVDEGLWEELQRILFLVCHLSGSAIRLVLALDESEGEALLLSHQKMIETRLLQLL